MWSKDGFGTCGLKRELVGGSHKEISCNLDSQVRNALINVSANIVVSKQITATHDGTVIVGLKPISPLWHPRIGISLKRFVSPFHMHVMNAPYKVSMVSERRIQNVNFL